MSSNIPRSSHDSSSAGAQRNSARESAGVSGSKHISDFILNEFIPFHPAYTREEILSEFLVKAGELGLRNAGDELLFEAFTHKSFAHEAKIELANNERLEFLGDSVLQLIVSEYLIKLYPNEKEGRLSKLRSSIVNENTLSMLSKKFSLDSLIILGKGEYREGGFSKPSLLANCFEAYLGAIYLSKGFDQTQKLVINMLESVVNDGRDLFHMDAIEDFDAKSRLQEALVKIYHEPPKYICTDLEGEKERLFHIELVVKGHKLGELTHKSKKKGMQALAKNVLEELNFNKK